jgi:DNA-directed RNA polymerase specialized sigma24 family protein
MSSVAAHESQSKPSFETVYEYALKSTEHHIRRSARHLSQEQKEDIIQTSMLRTWEAYKNLNADLGWKSFIGLHCRGAVLDYLKGGSFEEGLGGTSQSDDALKYRVEILNDNDDAISVENTAAVYGVFTDAELPDVEGFDPKWELLSKMASEDESLMMIGKILLGYTQEEVAAQSYDDLKKGVSRERVSQKVYELFAKMDSPFYLHDMWINQCIYALGLSKHYHMHENDNGVGHDLHPVDLNDPLSFKKARRWIQPAMDIEAAFDHPQTQDNEHHASQ